MKELAICGAHSKVVVKQKGLFGEPFYCLGCKVAEMIGPLVASLPQNVWYGAGLRSSSEMPAALSDCILSRPWRIGDGSTLLSALGEASQLLAGRIAAIAEGADGRKEAVALISFVDAERMEIAALDPRHLDPIARAFDLPIEAVVPAPEPIPPSLELEDDPILGLRRNAGWLSRMLILIGLLLLAMQAATLLFVLPILGNTGILEVLFLAGSLIVNFLIAVVALGLSAFIRNTADALTSISALRAQETTPLARSEATRMSP